MAKIVYAAGTAHSPMLTLDPKHWVERAKADYASNALNLSDGRMLDYPQLLELSGGKYQSEIEIERLTEKATACSAALDRLAADLEAAAVDVVVIVGDDQDELFGMENLPAIAIFHGEEMVMHSSPEDGLPEWRVTARKGYAMDDYHIFPGKQDLALAMIRGLLDRDVDIGSSARVSDPARAGFGHAYGFVIRRLFGDRQIPVVPILLNTYFPPNVLSAARCFDIGGHVRAAIEAWEPDLRVAIIASGGLSHFVVDEDLDQRVLKAIQVGDAEALRSIPREALLSGSSEILNWILAIGALAGHPSSWTEYVPLYRTPAGTGVGAAFASWRLEEA